MGPAVLTIILASTLFFPAMVYAWGSGFNFLETVIFCMLGGCLGYFFYGYLGKFVNDFLKTHIFKKRKARKFKPLNRRLVKVRRGYGLLGIALLTPVIKNPLGFAIGMSLSNNKVKLFLYMFFSMLFWVLLACSLYYGFKLDISKYNPLPFGG